MIYIYIYIFSVQFNNNSNKKNCPTHGFNLNQHNPCGLGWVGLGWTYMIGWVGLGWVEFFFNQPWWVGSKNPFLPTQPNPCTPLPIDLEASLAKIYEYFSIIIFKNISIKLFILHFILLKYYFLSIFYYSPKSSNLHI